MKMPQWVKDTFRTGRTLVTHLDNPNRKTGVAPKKVVEWRILSKVNMPYPVGPELEVAAFELGNAFDGSNDKQVSKTYYFEGKRQDGQNTY